MAAFPQRKWLHHNVPLSIDAAGAIFFITVCCRQKGMNTLCKPDIASALFDTIQHRVDLGIWWPRVFLLMPDHVHFLTGIAAREKSLVAIMREWKSWTRKQIGLTWQAGFFEHRLRTHESARKKADYILQNPVRAGLVTRWEDWPYIWFPDR